MERVRVFVHICKICSLSLLMKLLRNVLTSSRQFSFDFPISERCLASALFSKCDRLSAWKSSASEFCNGTAKDTYYHHPPRPTPYGPDKSCGILCLPTRLSFWSHILINQLPNFHVEFNLHGMFVSEHCDPPLCFLREKGCLRLNTRSQGTPRFSTSLSCSIANPALPSKALSAALC